MWHRLDVPGLVEADPTQTGGPVFVFADAKTRRTNRLVDGQQITGNFRVSLRYDFGDRFDLPQLTGIVANADQADHFVCVPRRKFIELECQSVVRRLAHQYPRALYTMGCGR